jgi:transcriptional regulator of acetoin/glycerol metabolism
MARSLVIVISEDPSVIQKGNQLASNSDVSVKVYSHQQWNLHLEDKTFRSQLTTQSTSTESQGATVLPFPGAHTGGANHDAKSVSTINDLESMAIKNAIFEYKGNLTEAAKALGIGRATLYRKVKQYNIDPQLARKRTARAA